jgi:hypothetical protein
MTTHGRLHVRVNDELVLDAGTCEEVSGPRGPERVIRPSAYTQSHTRDEQILNQLRREGWEVVTAPHRGFLLKR